MTVVGVAREGLRARSGIPDVFVPLMMTPQMTLGKIRSISGTDYWLRVLARRNQAFPSGSLPRA